MVSKKSSESQVIEIEKRSYNNPIVICGFASSTPTGVLTASYMIETLGLHQVAHLISQHVPPVTVFVGGKLRHPFRIYANNSNTLLVAVCEVPILTSHIYEISNALMSWLEEIGASEIAVIEGSPVSGIPEDRNVYSVAEKRRLDKLKKVGIPAAESALIAGMGGGMLNECLVRRMSGISFITPTSADIPDPGAVLSVVNALNKVYNLNIETDLLEQQVKELNDQIKKIEEQYKELQNRQKQEPQSMYG
ncbi:hypothetical protein [Thermoplasma volcanium GSS1]|uniref:Proteasome assembly chaperone family protein n=1 Tax=Thermoplasma volcanium (strain ATCC 51530 / DSM 4299 / JCM 9571 / NBRC 15438 / GSS1) TaxID=273116 RepID=Q97CI6_THEVO|nr:PAC2 family protein [Thermoplasma volcanium]BAB59257.1 hypothetical protein [Thermoplasma volcanium GSS1]